MLRRRAGLASDGVGHSVGSAAAGGGHEAAGGARRLPAPAPPPPRQHPAPTPSTAAARPAYPLLRLTFSGSTWREHRAWLRHAPLDVISKPAMIEAHTRAQCDAWLGVSAPENTRDGADISAERSSALEKAYRDARSPLAPDTPSVMCWYPTPALAQDAGMTLPAFAD